VLINSRPAHVDEDLDEDGRIVNDELLPLWRKIRHLPEETSAALGLLNIIRHFFYARMDGDHTDYKVLHSLTVETQAVQIMDQQGSSHHNARRPCH